MTNRAMYVRPRLMILINRAPINRKNKKKNFRAAENRKQKKVFCAINKNNIKSGILDHENNKLIYLRELLKQ